LDEISVIIYRRVGSSTGSVIGGGHESVS